MTNPNPTLQERFDAYAAELRKAFTDEVAKLKDAISSAPQAPATELDFSGFDKLLGDEKAEVSTVTPQLIPSDHPSLVVEGSAAPAPIGATAPSPFVDADADGDTAAKPDGDADDATPDPGPVPTPTEPPAPEPPA